ncbi:MAG: CBS domain-containing protein [Thermodesulfovibrionales bacterium]
MNPEEPRRENRAFAVSVDISDDDVVEAMKEIGGYLDITPGDLKDVLRVAHLQARKRIANSVRAENIMTAKVLTVHEDTPLKDVADLMAEHRISGVPVLSHTGKITGMISERDFLSRMGSAGSISVMGMIAGLMKGQECPAALLHSLTAADIMSSPAITVTVSMTLFEIMELFSSRKINRAPVVDADNRLQGIVSRGDIVRSPLTRMR